ncbi:hypothetical protein BASA50_000526 [Batrachochytrium salamandrivorans]|uniref:RxLR effector protein n=1 Tax=Batrachochytrium salamandrivorans TaxID=1357716 RepID=A0ABQ8EU13_9FUNG|nr:hypothetical protein BASA50_000526 [Batrachochytrium salamandrivorans]
MKFCALVISTLVAATSVYALAIPDAAAPETQSLNFKRDASLVSASGHQQIHRRSPQYDGDDDDDDDDIVDSSIIIYRHSPQDDDDE